MTRRTPIDETYKVESAYAFLKRLQKLLATKRDLDAVEAIARRDERVAAITVEIYAADHRYDDER